LDGGEGVGDGGGWYDSCCCEDLKTAQTFIQSDSNFKIVHHLLLSLMSLITLRIKRTDTSPMLPPLMLPERLVIPLIILPVRAHILEQIRLTIRLEDSGDVGVFAARVAVRFVCAVALVGPEAVDRPTVVGAGAWRCVPELRQQ